MDEKDDMVLALEAFKNWVDANLQEIQNQTEKLHTDWKRFLSIKLNIEKLKTSYQSSKETTNDPE